jgi:hypothetical protein
MLNKKYIGYMFLGCASLCWIFPFCIGLVKLPIAQKTILLTTIVILGEVFFVASIMFLGKPFMQKLKWKIRLWWRYLRANKFK